MDIPEEKNGDVDLRIYADPMTEDYSYEQTLCRKDVIAAMQSIDDYQENSAESRHNDCNALSDGHPMESVRKEFLCFAKTAQICLENIPKVIQTAKDMGFSHLAEFVEAYPVRYLHLRKQFLESKYSPEAHR